MLFMSGTNPINTFPFEEVAPSTISLMAVANEH
jgi:hypothetical protein